MISAKLGVDGRFFGSGAGRGVFGFSGSGGLSALCMMSANEGSLFLSGIWHSTCAERPGSYHTARAERQRRSDLPVGAL